MILFSVMKKIKNNISKLIKNFGYEIHRTSEKSNSLKEPFYHFRDLINHTQPVIFDVGAFVGDTVEQFKSSFPESWIHAFEPFNESYAILNNRFKNTDRTFSNNFAMGDSLEKDAVMHVTQNIGSSSLLQPTKNANEFWKGSPLSVEKKVKIKITTIDKYCQKKKIKKIDILKIDVQGNEIKVLKGAKRMLEEKKIKLIFTEISIAANYEGQSEIDEVIRFLRSNKYRIFNFFKMKHKNGKLIECDVLFYLE